MDLPKDAQEKIKKLQGYEQKVSALGLQRHKVESELSEVESALNAISDKETSEIYKIIGNVMVAADKPSLKKELEEQKKKVQLRITSIEKQEDQLRQVAEAMQKEVLKEMRG
jgi:prefoldin beta subunit